MSVRARRLAWVSVAILVGAALFFVHRSARRSAEQRFANLSACLLGDPLAQGESASARVRAIGYARPFQKMKLDGNGMHARFVPEHPLPPGESWPARCAPEARAFGEAAALRFIAPRARDRAKALLEDLSSDRAPSGLDELFREARALANPSIAPEPNIPRPWAPVALLPQDNLVDVTTTCPPFSLNATVDAWERDTIVLGGKPGCSIGAAPGSPARIGKTPLERKNTDKLEGVWKAHVLGWQLTIENGKARLRPEKGDAIELGEADSFSTCNAGAARAVLLSSHAPEAFDLRFIDERGVSSPARVVLEAPDFPGHGETKITHGELRMNCREREARIAWAWSSAVEQEHRHMLTIAACTPGHCELRRAPATIPTISSQGCGYCDPDVNPYSVASPQVVDLFDAVALVWSAGKTERARIAPLERLIDARDIVLWEKPENSYDEAENVRARSGVAIVGVSVVQPNEAHLFRLDANGASPLSPE